MDIPADSLKDAAKFAGVAAAIAGCAGAGVAAVGVLGGVKVGLITGFIFQSSEKLADKDENIVQTISKIALGTLAALGVTLSVATTSLPAAVTFIGYSAAITAALVLFKLYADSRDGATS